MIEQNAGITNFQIALYFYLFISQQVEQLTIDDGHITKIKNQKAMHTW